MGNKQDSLTQRRRPGPFTLVDQVDALVEAREADAELGFMARLMTLCSLPRSNPGKKREYVRRNGPFTLVMYAGANQRLPYGTLPRLLMSWLSSEAVRTQSREIVLGDSLSEFMRALGIYSNAGRVHLRLKNQMQRLFQSQVQLVYEDENGGGFVNAAIADRIRTPRPNGQLPLKSRTPITLCRRQAPGSRFRVWAEQAGPPHPLL